MGSDQNLGNLLYVGHYPTQLNRDYERPLYKDPYEAIDIMDCHKGFVAVAQVGPEPMVINASSYNPCNLANTVDGRNPAPPGMVKTL